MDTDAGQGPVRAGRREWVGLAVLALPAMLITLDFSVLNLAVPALSADLRPGGTQLLWIVDVYGFLLAGFLVTMGTVGDRIGRRRLLMIGAAGFGVASVLAAYASSAATLIGARALLGVAGATLMPSTLSLIGTMFRDQRQRTFAIAVWSTSLPIGGAIGPLVGGALLEWFWWGAAFLLGVPVMVLLLVTAPALLPEYRDAGAGRPDLASVVLSLAAILPVIYGLKQIAQDGPEPTSAMAIVVGLVIGVVFVRRQRRLADPLIDLRLLRVPAFSVSLVVNLLTYLVILGTLFLIAQYLQLVLGLSPLRAGLWTLPAMAGLIVGALLTPLAVRRVRPASVMAAGLVVAAVGFVLLIGTHTFSALAVVVAGSAVFCVGLAPVTTLVVNVALGAAPPEKAGAASGLSESSTELGGALGIAVLGSIATAVYRGFMDDRIPDTVPVDDAAAARDTLGGAVDVAGQVPDPLAAALLGPAREAFTAGLHTVAAVCAVIVAALAVVTAVLLRHVRLGAATASSTTRGG